MAKPVCGKGIAAHRIDQAGDLARAAAHQRPLEGGKLYPIQRARRNTDDVFCGGTDFVSNQILSIIKADQIS